MPGKLKWKESYSVNHDLIDSQHKELFRLIDDFYEKIYYKSGKEVVSGVIKKLEEYVLMHFAAEEGILSELGYKHLDEHRKEHQDFVEKVKDFRNRHDEGRLLLSIEVSNFIKEWIVKHILESDQQYKPKLNSLQREGSSTN